MIKIKSVTGMIHDTGFGGYPYKVVVMVEIATRDFNKMCPIFAPSQNTICGRRAAKRDLGNLVMSVNSAVYSISPYIPAFNPSIDSQGSQRAKNGIKTMEFVYFFKCHDRAEQLGFEVMRFKDGHVHAKYGQRVSVPCGTEANNG